MNCPRCSNVVLTEQQREGLVVDLCAACRGIWLDRGELEKLISRATREFDELDEVAPHSERTPTREVRYRERDHDERGRAPKKKRRWVDTLGELFD
jgi:Zn-finger nucleic acid-binding protein